MISSLCSRSSFLPTSKCLSTSVSPDTTTLLPSIPRISRITRSPNPLRRPATAATVPFRLPTITMTALSNARPAMKGWTWSLHQRLCILVRQDPHPPRRHLFLRWLTLDSFISRPIKRQCIFWQFQQEDQFTPKVRKSDAGTHSISSPVALVLMQFPSQDELRLMKRKEQNRAAQRAFRERKEKHVKDVGPIRL